MLACHEAAKRAHELARKGQPSLIVLKTYRMLGHSSSDDPTKYRSEDEVAAWAAKDPIKLFRERVETDGIFPREDLDAIEARIDEEVREAAAWAQQQPDPRPEDALGFVYKEL